MPSPPGSSTTTRRDTRIALILLSVGGVALVALVGVIVLILINLPSRETLAADAIPIVNAEAALRQAESRVSVLLRMQESREDDSASYSRITCWFSYPADEEAARPKDAVRCGPLVFADSEPGTHWLSVPVHHKETDEGVRVTVGQAGSLRTVTLEPGEQLWRPDGDEPPEPDDLDLERPPAPAAEPGQMGLVPVDAVMVEMEESEDATLTGMSYEWELLRSGTADRVRLQDRPFDEATVLGAPEGHRWLIFEMSVDMEDPVFGSDSLELAITADDESFPLDSVLDPGPLSFEDATVIAAVVPDDAEDVSLIVDDGMVEQGWSFTKGERSGDTPAILDREPDTLTAQIEQEFTLPYGARDLNPIPAGPPPPPGLDVEPLPPIDSSRAFGVQELKLQVGEARLGYALHPGLSADSLHTASGPDRALLYLADVEESWGQLFPDVPEVPEETPLGYKLPPKGAVLVLPDGTEIVASSLGSEPWGSSTEPGGFGGLQQGLFGGLVWDVPADLDTATLRITFLPGNDAIEWFEIYFQDATIEIELDFGSSS